MTNRLAMTLAVAGGYVLGRTKKAKLAIGIGGMVLGKKLQLNPQQLMGMVNKQLASNPALGELRDQLTGDLKGVGKAATGALVSRQLDSLADSLSKRTSDVRDRLESGRLTGPLTDSAQDDDAAEDEEDEGPRNGAGEDEDRQSGDREKKATGKSGSADRGGDRSDGDRSRPARKAPAKKSASAGSASRGAGTAKKTATKTASARSTSARSTGSRTKSTGRAAGKAAARGGERRG
ncbi:DNA primase [Streptomyces sp. NPDC059740]|uniref:DNA primase n=1 Tax=Streptomyces sp. NPDC059740 TaxID=3346926 RepID=UPI00365EAD02